MKKNQRNQTYICIIAVLVFAAVVVGNILFSDAFAKTSMVEIPDTDFGHPAGVTWYVTPTPEPTPVKTSKKKKDNFVPIKGCPWSKSTQKKVKKITDKYHISFPLIMSMAYEESRFNQSAIGDDGQALGAWQIHPRVWKGVIHKLGYQSEDMKKVLPAAEVTCYIMEAHFKRRNEVYFALMAWNGGGDYANRKMDAGEISRYALRVEERSRSYE